jgi:hypothetical protein
VEVEAVIPTDDPSEACYEPETVEFLRQVHERADAGDLDWLKKIGKVFLPLPAA